MNKHFTLIITNKHDSTPKITVFDVGAIIALTKNHILLAFFYSSIQIGFAYQGICSDPSSQLTRTHKQIANLLFVYIFHVYGNKSAFNWVLRIVTPLSCFEKFFLNSNVY